MTSQPGTPAGIVAKKQVTLRDMGLSSPPQFNTMGLISAIPVDLGWRLRGSTCIRRGDSVHDELVLHVWKKAQLCCRGQGRDGSIGQGMKSELACTSSNA